MCDGQLGILNIIMNHIMIMIPIMSINSLLFVPPLMPELNRPPSSQYTAVVAAELLGLTGRSAAHTSSPAGQDLPAAVQPSVEQCISLTIGKNLSHVF